MPIPGQPRNRSVLPRYMNTVLSNRQRVALECQQPSASAAVEPAHRPGLCVHRRSCAISLKSITRPVYQVMVPLVAPLIPCEWPAKIADIAGPLCSSARPRPASEAAAAVMAVKVLAAEQAAQAGEPCQPLPGFRRAQFAAVLRSSCPGRSSGSLMKVPTEHFCSLGQEAQPG